MLADEALCPDENALARFSEGSLSKTEQEQIESHLDSCDSCRLIVGAAVPDEVASNPVPTQLGRYRLGALIGAGGMGRVFVAEDAQLRRKVAIKLLGTFASDDAQARLLREAQAMARLAHPNVLAVHDVGTADGHVFIAMELVEGPTLGRWLGEPHGWREALNLMVAAGRGLSAAHAAGLVHRDFKPDNVLIADGRPRVTDFGLVRWTVESTPRAMIEPNAPLDSPLTRAGTLLGTPAYMAPEQLAGLPADAQSDQFSFCVALAEALFGERPFSGATVQARQQAIAAGPLLPRRAGVPARVLRAILRGLEVDPQRRFPSMEALLHELDEATEPRPSRRRLATIVVAVLMIGLTGAWVSRSRWLSQPIRPTHLVLQSGEEAIWPDPQLERVKSSNESVARAMPIEGTGLRILAGQPGQVEVSLWDHGARAASLLTVEVKRPEPLNDEGKPRLSIRVGERHWLAKDAARVALEHPNVADVKVEDNQIWVLGVNPGETLVVVWDSSGKQKTTILTVVP